MGTPGLVNLNDNGPEDGGLMLLEGSAKLFESYFDSYGRTETRHGGFRTYFGHLRTYDLHADTCRRTLQRTSTPSCPSRRNGSTSEAAGGTRCAPTLAT